MTLFAIIASFSAGAICGAIAIRRRSAEPAHIAWRRQDSLDWLRETGDVPPPPVRCAVLFEARFRHAEGVQ